jgi:hypothetical protein
MGSKGGVMKAALELAKELMLKDLNIQSVSIGIKYKDGKSTGKESIVFAVEKKRAESDPGLGGVIVPYRIQGVETDVQERVIFAPPLPLVSPLSEDPLALTGRKRPCPPGYSVGHYLVTAGTLGFWAKRGDSEDYFLFSNNHVLANSNACRPNDEIRQPGVHDGGTSSDRFAALEDYVEINFEGGNGGGCNLIGRVLALFKQRSAIKQPNPNLVDAAVARVINQSWVEKDYPGEMGEAKGFRDLQLGDKVIKVGRTTEITTGTVEGVDALVRVNYGGPVALFDQQLEIRGDNGDFSAAGDSGSAIISEDEYIGALLFAGGGGITIASRISHVISLLGARL